MQLYYSREKDIHVSTETKYREMKTTPYYIQMACQNHLLEENTDKRCQTTPVNMAHRGIFIT